MAFDRTVDPSVARDNFARVHRTLKTTPAKAAGVADHKGTLREIAALLD